ncbi:MAG TPA: hypothetical protein VGR59_16090 [Gemmatimonadaceae bacterium]|nr:hypothetical protein [Gemmatimonadaceae bacterium]
MMMRTLRLASLVAACVGVAAASLGAQQIPGTAAKNAARRVVAATNAHTSAMQNTDAPAPTQAPATPTRVADAPHGARLPNHPAPVPEPAAAAPSAARGHAPANRAPHGAARARDTVTLTSQQGPNGDGTTSISERGGKNEIALMRESFTYDADGRRDPFVSLIASGELRPMISDLRLVVVIYDPAGRSVAILRDVSTKEQYRVKTGQTLGRMRVARIDLKSVTFTLEEFGYSRQETLALNDSTRARSQ